MLTILHGENIVASRRALEELKKKNKGKEIILLEGKNLTFTDLKQATEAKSLFSLEKIVVIENLALKKGEVFDYLKATPEDVNIILWQGKKVRANILSQFKKAKVLKFKIPAIIFKFLDSLIPARTKESLNLLKQLLRIEPIEIVFYMLIRQFRILLAVKTSVKIDEVKRLAPWQQAKFKRQASFFSFDQLLKIYKEFLIIDYQVKTGRSALNLKQRLEHLLTTLGL